MLSFFVDWTLQFVSEKLFLLLGELNDGAKTSCSFSYRGRFNL